MTRKKYCSFCILHREPAVGERRRGETGNTFCEQRTKRIMSIHLLLWSGRHISVGCDGMFPL